VAKFQPGRSGNPGGRRKQTQATRDLLQEIKHQLAQAGPEGKLSNGAVLVQAMIASAVAGDVGAQKELLNRVIGRVPVAAPPEDVDLEVIAHRMAARRIELEAEHRLPVGTASLPAPAPGKRQAPSSQPRNGFVELPEPEPDAQILRPPTTDEPPAEPPPTVNYIHFPGFGDFSPQG